MNFVALVNAHTHAFVFCSSGSAKPAAAAAPAAAPAPAAAAAPARPAGGFLSELTKGTDITSGLKKVDKSQMTHKNPELRATSVKT